MKKLIALLAALTLLLSLAACGEAEQAAASNNSADGSAAVTTDAPEAAPTEADPEPDPALHHTDLFSVCVPDGWMLFPSLELDDSVNQRKVFIFKDVESELGMFRKCGVTVEFFDDYEQSDADRLGEREWTANTVSITAGSNSWSGYRFDSFDNGFVRLFLRDGDKTIRVDVQEENSEAEISYTDEDVVAILSSIRCKN